MAFKTVVVKALLKKPNLDENILSNYKPISNLPFMTNLPLRKEAVLVPCYFPYVSSTSSMHISIGTQMILNYTFLLSQLTHMAYHL